MFRVNVSVSISISISLGVAWSLPTLPYLTFHPSIISKIFPKGPSFTFNFNFNSKVQFRASSKFKIRASEVSE